MLELVCKNVLGGWQSFIKGTNVAVGPVFRDTVSLWNWQRDNVYNNMNGES
jgi:hypothetical protein